MKQKFNMEKSMLVKLAVCFGIIAIFWVLPPAPPLTQVGMRVIGVFIGTVLLLSLVDTVWPALLAVAILSRTGVATLNEAIIGSLGSWVIYFILMSFIMTHALNESGFTNRLVAKFMGIKFVSKNPWTFTFSIGFFAMILGCFMDQIPATTFMLAFVQTVYKELGYKTSDSYPHITNIVTVFSVNIGGAMTPISHALTIIGLGIYENITGEPLSLFAYLAFGVPTGLILFILMCVAVRIFAKPDFSKFEGFDIKKVIATQKKVDLREICTVIVFFVTVALWIAPGLLMMFTDAAWVSTFNSYGITFWAILSVIIMALVHIDNKPLVNVKEVVNNNINWGILLFISIGIYLGTAISLESTGVTEFIQTNITPLLSTLPSGLVVFFIAFVAVFMTNFASNVTTITVMTGVGVTLAMSSGGMINPIGIAMVTTMCGCCAYLLPSSFGTIALLHGNSYSSKNNIYIYGIIMMILSALIIGFVGYPLGVAIVS